MDKINQTRKCIACIVKKKKTWYSKGQLQVTRIQQSHTQPSRSCASWWKRLNLCSPWFWPLITSLKLVFLPNKHIFWALTSLEAEIYSWIFSGMNKREELRPNKSRRSPPTFMVFYTLPFVVRKKIPLGHFAIWWRWVESCSDVCPSVGFTHLHTGPLELGQRDSSDSFPFTKAPTMLTTTFLYKKTQIQEL